MILFTYPTKVVGEEVIINQLFELGLTTLHLRKPEASHEEMVNFVHSIDKKYWGKIMIHSNLGLINYFPLKGIHFSEINKPLFERYRFAEQSKSWASHHLEELANIPTSVDYTFLSPIFPSTSKIGYAKEWDFELVASTLKKRKRRKTKVVALGGITVDNAQKCRELGFDDFAVLGAIWEPFIQNNNVEEIKDIFLKMNEIWQ